MFFLLFTIVLRPTSDMFLKTKNEFFARFVNLLNTLYGQEAIIAIAIINSNGYNTYNSINTWMHVHYLL